HAVFSRPEFIDVRPRPKLVHTMLRSGRMRGRYAARLRSLFAGAAATAMSSCAAPTLTQEGQLVFTENPQHGATVLTANGVEFVDRATLPKPVRKKSAFEPWRPPIGFLLPADGVLRETSRPIAIEGRGLVVVLRASDAIVPAWGGELLLRIDAI